MRRPIFLPIAVRLQTSNQRLLQGYLACLRKFLNRLEKIKPDGLNKIAKAVDKEVWSEVSCLNCANCCKAMTPTFTRKDINRIAAHFNQSAASFTEKWLFKEPDGGDIVNKQQPCQFLNLKDNKCSIYEIRPDDCRSFPHHGKKNFAEWTHIYKQNIEHCPATYKLVEKMREKMKIE